MTAAAAAPAPTAAPVILVYGDSLSAGYGIDVEHGWVKRLALKLHGEGYGFQVVNASVSGETTTGGLARLPRALQAHVPRIVVLELGANDGLRGLPLATTRANLEGMLKLISAPGRGILVLGIRMPPNYGARYNDEFAALFPAAARRHRAALVPFLLTGVAGNPDLMQPDGLHPNERGQPLVLDNVWAGLQPLLRKLDHRRVGE